MFQDELCKARESILNHFECMCLEIKKVMDECGKKPALKNKSVKSWEVNKFYQK